MIYFPKIYGTCGGANKALEMAIKLKEEYKDKNVYIYKEILHNPYIIEDLKKKGILCIEDLDIVKEDDILIIRAHGEPKDKYDELKRRKINYYDATCINVIKVHELVEKKHEEGKNIIIVGKKKHPEVIATNGWCNNEATIIETEDDLKEIKKDKEYYMVYQTTIGYEKVSMTLNYLNTNKINYTYDNTICAHQKLIQTSSIDLSKQMDVMFVIGGETSSNTKELFNECKKVCETYYFSNINDFYNFIKKQNYTKTTKIGLTGGASTPKSQISEYMHLLEFFIYYKDRLKVYEKEIVKFNKTFQKEDNNIIDDAIDKFAAINKGGKYLRGCLIDLGYKLNKKDEYATPLAIAYETFQTAILVHDDIIDNAILRRGKETIHYTYQKEFEKLNHIDNTPTSLALCLGDLGFFYTNELIVKKYKNDKNFAKLFSYYNNIVINTIKGEILDVALPFKEKYDKNNILKEEDIMKIYKMKTSWYTVVGPFCLGMILGNSKQKDIELFESILEPLGIAFQIKDDILGIYSSNDILGKSVYSDIEEFKQTILYSYVKLNNKEKLKELLKYYGNETKEQDAKKVQEIFEESGALEYANKMMENMFYKAKTDIARLQIDSTVKYILLGLITYLELREK